MSEIQMQIQIHGGSYIIPRKTAIASQFLNSEGVT
jgi:hypothetical protein